MPRSTGRATAAPAAKKATKATTGSARKAKAVTTSRSAKGAVKAVKRAAPAKKATPVSKAAAPKATPARKSTPAKAGRAAGRAPGRAPSQASARKTTGTARKAPAAARGRRSATLDKFVLAQRTVLLDERATYTRQAESLRAEADLLAADREPGDVQFDEESGEGDTLAVERERDLALSAQASQAVEEIDRALSRIDAGTYGTCSQCGQPIPKERLRALPYAALCVRCKSGGLGWR